MAGLYRKPAFPAIALVLIAQYCNCLGDCLVADSHLHEADSSVDGVTSGPTVQDA